MSRFLVVLSSKTLIKFEPERDQYIFDYSNVKVKFRRIISKKDMDLSRIKNGFIIEIELDAKNLDDSIDESIMIAEAFLSLFCFESGFPTDVANVILAYNITEKTEKRVFRQFLDIPHETSGNELDLAQVKRNAKKILFNSDKSNERINRAIRWFRKGLMVSDPIEQFTSFWQGLETINPLLVDSLDTEKSAKKEITRKCKNCGEDYKEEITTLGGIEALYDSMGIDESVRKDINSLRQGIVHGFRSIPELKELSLNLNPLVAKILHMGISSVLNISYEESLYNNLKRVSPIKLGDRFYCQCFINEINLKNLRKHYFHPYIGVQINEEGKPQLQNMIGVEITDFEYVMPGKNIDFEIEES